MTSDFYRAAEEYYSDHEREKIMSAPHGPLCICEECMATDWEGMYEAQQENNMDAEREER